MISPELAIVATVARADALSVVALALAVLAFVVQIIVFIVQGNAASQQAADTAALNAQTLRALATIEERSEGTRETVVKMNDRLFDFALTKARLEAETTDSAEGTQSVTGLVLERAKEVVRYSDSADSADGEAALAEGARPTTSGERTKETDQLHGATPSFDTPFTGEEEEIAARVLEKLRSGTDALPLVSIYRLAQDWFAAEKADRPGQAGLNSINSAKTCTKRVWSSEWSHRGLTNRCACSQVPAG